MMSMERPPCRLSLLILSGTVAYGLFLLLLLILVLRGEQTPDLRLESVTHGEPVGSDLSLEVLGSGFHRETRLSLALETGSEEALVTAIPTWSLLQGIAVDGSLAYLVSNYRGIQTLDLSDPEQPRLLGSQRTPGKAWRIALAGRLAYLASREGGVQIVDISDPRNLRIVSSVETGGLAVDIAQAGNRVYVANSLLGLQAIDVTDPDHPLLLGSAEAGTPFAVAIRDDYILVADARGTLQIFAVPDGRPPQIASTLPIPGGALGVAVHRDLAYVVGRRGLHVIDIRQPQKPCLVAAIATPGTARGITVRGDRAFVVDSAGGLLVFDLTRPGQPQLISAYQTPGVAGAVAVSGELAYVSTGRHGLAIVDVSRHNTPPTQKKSVLPPGFRFLTKAGDRLYLANKKCLLILDIGDPACPEILGSLPIPSLGLEIALAGNRAYIRINPSGSKVSTEQSGILVADLSDPRHPQAVDFIPLADLRALAVRENLLFAGSSESIRIFDAAEPLGIRQIGLVETQGSVQSLLADGRRLYAGTREEGVLVFAVDRPEKPVLLGSARLPWHFRADSLPRQLDLVGTTLLMADGANGLLLYNMTDPRQPKLLASVPVQGYAIDFTVTGHLVYLTDSRFGLLLVDISRPERPEIVAAISAPNATVGFAVHPDRVFLLTREGELSIVPGPIPPRDTVLQSGGRLTAVFPRPPLPGTYSLNVSDGFRRRVYPSAVTISKPGDPRETGRGEVVKQ